jgi:septum formation protein
MNQGENVKKRTHTGSGKDEMRYILGSASPRRIDMFRDHGFDPVVIPSHGDESMPMELGPVETTLFLALKKALSVKSQLESMSQDPDTDLSGKGVIITADTIVYQDEVLGKPEDRQDAHRILSKLNNSSHSVITGVALLRTDIPYCKLFAEESIVTFHPYEMAELEPYLDTTEAYDKAGAYAIQGTFGKYVKEYTGDIRNIMGLPWESLVVELEKVALK